MFCLKTVGWATIEKDEERNSFIFAFNFADYQFRKKGCRFPADMNIIFVVGSLEILLEITRQFQDQQDPITQFKMQTNSRLCQRSSKFKRNKRTCSLNWPLIRENISNYPNEQIVELLSFHFKFQKDRSPVFTRINVLVFWSLHHQS